MRDFEPITLLMPVKNGERFLPSSFETLRQNCGPNDEILIVNDNSTDNTSAILQKLVGTSSNVVIVNNSNPGLANALNLGLTVASNEWIARFDVDDKYPSDRIELTRVNISNDSVGIFSDYSFVSDQGRKLGTMPSAIKAEFTYLSLVSSQRTAHPSVCFNKTAVQDVGGYQQEDFPAEDISLWLRLAKVGNLKTIPAVLLQYRLNPKSVSNTMRDKSIAKKNELISDYKFSDSIINESLTSLDETKAYYADFKSGNARYLLHLRDLLLILKHNPGITGKNLNYIYKKIYLDVKNYQPGQILFREMLLRRLYRLI
jgi:glycosyltransferase involved in cell wall biosynthesis